MYKYINIFNHIIINIKTPLKNKDPYILNNKTRVKKKQEHIGHLFLISNIYIGQQMTHINHWLSYLSLSLFPLFLSLSLQTNTDI